MKFFPQFKALLVGFARMGIRRININVLREELKCSEATLKTLLDSFIKEGLLILPVMGYIEITDKFLESQKITTPEKKRELTKKEIEKRRKEAKKFFNAIEESA